MKEKKIKEEEEKEQKMAGKSYNSNTNPVMKYRSFV